MSHDVIMPQMGESIAEGTVTKWLKKVGDTITRDEPLFEISTDKVDAEIPAPAPGVLLEVIVPEGETVSINTVVARIGSAEEASAGSAAPAPAKKTQSGAAESTVPAPAKKTQSAAPHTTPTIAPAASGAGGALTMEAQAIERLKTRSTPLVRKMAKEHGVDLKLVEGSGRAGRVTKNDMLQYIDRSAQPDIAPPLRVAPSSPPPAMQFPTGERVVRETMSVMRKKIAEHMVMSRRTSAHVQSWQECDMHNVVKARQALKSEFEQQGVKLTFTAFIAEAIVRGLQAYPSLNASIEGDDTIVYHQDINVGIAVALDWGLIVPVVKNTEQMNLLGLARSINDLAERARTKRLNVDEVQGGTFTITNPGIYGSLMGAPIINQPQAAILGVGVIKKRAVVIDDAIAIRPIMYLSLSFDHRLVDGAEAAQFIAYVVNELETRKVG